MYRSPLFDRAGIRHAFTTRIGGVSERPFDSLNLGNPPRLNAGDLQDSAEHLRQNHQIVQNAMNCISSRRRWCNQVHGNGVKIVDQQFDDGMEADALITSDSQDVLTIRVADCTPILLSTGDGSSVAAVHAGWRGIVAGIVPLAVARLADYSGSANRDIVAAIGPCIGFAAFEVGPDVSELFESQFGPGVVKRNDSSDRSTVDLRRSIEMQLQQAGVLSEKIESTDRCTFSHATEFFSHRRDHGMTGRMAAMISPNKANA